MFASSNANAIQVFCKYICVEQRVDFTTVSCCFGTKCVCFLYPCSLRWIAIVSNGFLMKLAGPMTSKHLQNFIVLTIYEAICHLLFTANKCMYLQKLLAYKAETYQDHTFGYVDYKYLTIRNSKMRHVGFSQMVTYTSVADQSTDPMCVTKLN